MGGGIHETGDAVGILIEGFWERGNFCPKIRNEAKQLSTGFCGKVVGLIKLGFNFLEAFFDNKLGENSTECTQCQGPRCITLYFACEEKFSLWFGVAFNPRNLLGS